MKSCISLSLVFRGDFSVQWHHHHISSYSVFSLLHYMAIVLLEKSIILQEKPQGKSSRAPVNTIYQRILWSKYACVQFQFCHAQSVLLRNITTSDTQPKGWYTWKLF